MTPSIERFFLSVAGLIVLAIVTPATAAAGEVYVNNMSDVAVQLTAYAPASAPSPPPKVLATWCVDTGDYDTHELKVDPAVLEADVMQVGCKEPVILGRKLTLAPALPKAPATLYRLTGEHGKYELSGPFSHAPLK